MTELQVVGTVPQWTRGDRLRKARTLTGLTTREFAATIGVSQKTVTDAEGDKRPTVRRPLMIAYAVATGVPLAWLETGELTPGPESGHRVNSGCSTPRRFRLIQAA